MTEQKARSRLQPHERRKIVIDAAIDLTVNQYDGDVYRMSQLEVANACATPTSRETVRYYFPTMTELRQTVTEALGK